MRKTFAFLAAALILLAVPATSAYKPDANAPRASVPEQYRWDLSPLFKDDASWEEAFAAARAKTTAILSHKGKLDGAPAVKSCLEDYFAARRAVDRAAAYANLRSVEDQDDAKRQEMLQRSLALGNDFRSSTSFIRQELLRLDDAAAKAILEDPSLAPYRGYVEDLRRRRSRLLGEEAERVLSLAGEHLWSETDLNEIPSDVELVFKAATKDIQLPKIKDEDGKEVQLTLANYSKYRASKDPRVRRETVESFFGALKKYENILAATLAAEAKRDVFMARARGYARSVDAYLDRQNIPASVAENLVAAVHENLGPLHRYVGLRKKLLGLKEIHIYDLYPPLVPSAQTEVPYEEGLKDLRQALKPLGEGYVAALFGPEMLGRRMADVYPSKGKESGAFSQSIWGFPPVVLLNYMDDLDDASTAAHELGHAMHSLLNMKAQPEADFGYSSLTAEIASTLNEVLLSKRNLKKYEGDPKTRLYLLGDMLDRIRTTIYRQALFSEFELKLHAFAEAGTPITAELLDKTYADLVRLYYGSDFTLGENDGVEWAYIPHFYWKHYVFSYACALASSIAISEKIAAGDLRSREGYLAMLEKPREAAPVETLKEAGVDLSKTDALKAAARLMDETIDEMEALAIRMK
ncbi:MAG: oligoendopeptidase F family protein [Elusimicrobia bacterium]|nr:oligoendopeptidase F family protein [Elusimicrobiota bacterium]